MKRTYREPIKLNECHKCGGKARFKVIRPSKMNLSVVRVECTECRMRTENFTGWDFPDEFKRKAAKSWNKWVNVFDDKERIKEIKSQSIQEEEEDYVI